MLPDVNVLLYAFREDSVDHAPYREWLDGLVNGDEAYGMSPQVLCSVVRIATPGYTSRRAASRTLWASPVCF